ncbi:MAG TPA: AlkA N-terminal domain-containing protein [Rhodocyclaceae bacterium]|nr:AlkA N-terminal domain-containing protein [Rhodocyclaceae bacterium]
MTTDATTLYAALLARDRRFDGRFYVGVSSTGIYCRPICRVRTPLAANCRFFAHAAAAEAAGFRPCLRCRPELAPGLAAIDASSRLAWAAAQRIEAGQLDDDGLTGLAARLGIGERHLRRIFGETFGVTPVAYAQTQRRLLAKRLLADTNLTITEVALAAGFGSLRRFNTLFRSHYGLTPSALRRESLPTNASDGLQCELAYRPPFDWPRLLRFLAARCIAGVEEVDGECYRRSVALATADGLYTGWIALRWSPQREAVVASVAPSLARVLPAVLAGVRRLADLCCEPQIVAAALGALAADAPGLRAPGAFDGFEMSVRAVVGQQVTVKAAHTLAGRFAAAFGERIETPFAAIERLFPSAQRVCALGVEEIAALGIVRQRATAILALAREVADGRLDLGPTANIAATVAQLEALPGIGRWTAQYIALRALNWPDAWPSGDVALIKSLGVATARAADTQAEAWRPWRSYATMHLWRRLAEGAATMGGKT